MSDNPDNPNADTNWFTNLMSNPITTAVAMISPVTAIPYVASISANNDTTAKVIQNVENAGNIIASVGNIPGKVVSNVESSLIGPIIPILIIGAIILVLWKPSLPAIK